MTSDALAGLESGSRELELERALDRDPSRPWRRSRREGACAPSGYLFEAPSARQVATR